MKLHFDFRPKRAPWALLLICLLWQAMPLAAQDLHIYYDLFTDSMTYEKEGKKIPKPVIRKGDFVVLHFTEYNPYLYNAEVDIEQSNSEDWAGGASAGALGPASGLMGMMSPFLGGASANPANPLSFMDMPLLSLGQSSLKLSDLFSNTRGADQILKEAQSHLLALSQIQAEMVEIQEEVQRFEKSERAAQLAIKNLDSLIRSPRIRPSFMRRVAMEYQSLIFPEKAESGLIEGAFQWQDRPKAKQRLLQALSAKQMEFDAQMADLDPVSRQLSNLDLGSPAFETFAKDLRTVIRKSDGMRTQVDAYIAAAQTGETLGLEAILALQMKLQELVEQPFSYPVAISVEKNTVIVKGRFIPIEAGEGSTRLGSISKTIKLTTSGGLRISSGFGVAFSRMNDPIEDFTIRDNVIVAEEGGVGQPSLATFVHFYPNMQGGLALAGTFGVGLPLSSGGISSLNFFLGPSLMFGRGQRIVLSGGLTAGPVKRLAKGFKVGDAFDPNNGDIPTRTKYDLGYFLGISFNIGG